MVPSTFAMKRVVSDSYLGIINLCVTWLLVSIHVAPATCLSYPSFTPVNLLISSTLALGRHCIYHKQVFKTLTRLVPLAALRQYGWPLVNHFVGVIATPDECYLALLCCREINTFCVLAKQLHTAIVLYCGCDVCSPKVCVLCSLMYGVRSLLMSFRVL